MKLGMVDYVRDLTPRDNFGRGSATWVVWTNMCLVKSEFFLVVYGCDLFLFDRCMRANDDNDDVRCEQVLQSPPTDQNEFNGRTSSGRRSKHNGSHGQSRAVPHIGLCLSSYIRFHEHLPLSLFRSAVYTGLQLRKGMNIASIF